MFLSSRVTYGDSISDRLGYRIRILEMCRTPSTRALVLEYCKRDIVFWAEHFAYTYDPRVTPSLIPFYLFPRQKEYLQWRLRRRSLKQNAIVEKSRDAGVSYLNVLSQVHCWLFESGYKGAFGSRKAMLVDRIGDPDSLFEKIRIILRNLPVWILPVGFDFDKHDNLLKIVNPATGGTITGEAGDEIGRGGRSAIYDVDEAAFLEHPKKVDAALSNNTDCIIYTSTANGTGNTFYQKRFSYPADWIFTFHWRSDPRKDDKWYAQMCDKFDAVTIASEVDIDYTASVENVFIPGKWVRAAINFDIPVTNTGEYRRAGLDVATSGKNLNVFIPRIGNVVRSPIAWSEPNLTVSAYKAKDLMIEFDLNLLSFDADGAGAGIASALDMDSRKKKLPFFYYPVRSGSSASTRYWLSENRTSKEKFANRRAEYWGLVRERFRKTYDHVTGVKEYPLEELISIPDNPELITQLSSPLMLLTSGGKTLVESKQQMAKRGIKSPDYADALIYSEETMPYMR